MLASSEEQAVADATGGVSVRPMREDDLEAADRVMRVAFGTFLGLPTPEEFMGDAAYIRSRFAADPEAAFTAELDGEVVGSNMATHWGSVAFFGPLTVRPDLWDRGIAGRLLEPTLELFERWGVRHSCLFTFAHSPKHTGLYQKFGFWPGALTAVMTKPVEAGERTVATYSELPQGERSGAIDACAAVTESVYGGLNLAHEIEATDRLGFGETVLLAGADGLDGLAVCHLGPGTEAGSDTCFVKFGAVRSGDGAGERFERLLDACDALSADRGASRLTAGANMGRREAFKAMVARGFRTDLQGVALHSGDDTGYNRPGRYVIDDWR
jgi:predicted N-acetyltransferase YhbS